MKRFDGGKFRWYFMSSESEDLALVLERKLFILRKTSRVDLLDAFPTAFLSRRMNAL